MEIVAKSEAMKEVLRLAERVAATDVNVLITGESGTGKNLIAEFIHQKSKRNSFEIGKVDCASLPKDLLEAELFGYEKGAFTGASEMRIGRLELAHKSTLLLDEIAHLPIDSQAKLLRVLEQKEFERLGGQKTIKIDVRIIATTNVDLEKAIAKKTFREDLFYRLNVVKIQVPSLSERRADIKNLAQDLLQFYSNKHSIPNLEFSENALKHLETFDFYGNVRELSNLIERAVIISNSNKITSENFPNRTKNDKLLTLQELEHNYVREILQKTNGNKSKAAEILGISRKNLYEKLAKMNKV
jgi:DNA-binding NtrC family response regulator